MRPAARCRRRPSCAQATAGAASNKMCAAPAVWAGSSGRHYMISVIITVFILIMFLMIIINHEHG